MSKKIYIICPVRNISEDWKSGIENYVKMLESQGNKVHLPWRDVEQDDKTGYNICEAHREAMEEADEVHIAWDGKSEGCLFDLGMAFALKKRISIIVGYFPPPTSYKSFASMVLAWEVISNKDKEVNQINAV